MAAILARSPQVGMLAAGAIRVPVAGAAPAARVVTEGCAIPVLRGTLPTLTLTPFKLAAICHFSHELVEFCMIENAVRVLLSQSHRGRHGRGRVLDDAARRPAQRRDADHGLGGDAANSGHDGRSQGAARRV